jgi:hypothetical protein
MTFAQVNYLCGIDDFGLFGGSAQTDKNGRYEILAYEPFGLIAAPDNTYRCRLSMTAGVAGIPGVRYIGIKYPAPAGPIELVMQEGVFDPLPVGWKCPTGWSCSVASQPLHTPSPGVLTNR